MHYIKNTFLAKEFDNKPAVGIKLDALKGNGIFEFQLRSNPLNQIYCQDKDYLRIYRSHSWKNKFGVVVKIFPLEIFNLKENPQKKLV